MKNLLILASGILSALSQHEDRALSEHAAPAPAAGDDHDDHDDHDHGDHAAHAGAFEWGGIFETPDSTYLWTAQKTESGSDVDYVDPTMKIVMLPAASATDAALHSLESQGSELMEGTCTDVNSGDVIIPRTDRCYRLMFKQDWWQSLYSIDATGLDAIAIFCEHFPTEFENTAHYLKDDHGVDIEPAAEIPESSETAEDDADKPWGPAIAVAVIVNFVTLTGVILMVPALSKAAKDYADQFECVASAFAAGAISACAFFLLLFEATHLIAAEHKEEVEQIWRWGTMILAGATFPALMHLALEQFMGQAPAEANPEDKANLKVQPSGARIIAGILLGDFVHNLCDGFFIGAAFVGCGESFGWTVASGTVAHELAQEISDYVILTGRECGLKPLVALALNFLSGTGVLLGTIITMSSDVSDGEIGLLLAFGGGTYLYIAFVECMPKVMGLKVTVPVRALALFVFMLGAIAIGLVLLDHEHCIPPSADGEAGGHAHGHDH